MKKTIKYTTSAGVAVPEALLMLVIALVIGGTAYYVYDSRKDTSDSLDNSSQSQSDPQKTDESESSPQDGKTTVYENTTLKFSLSYPKDWSKENAALSDPFKENVTFKSPDYKQIADDPFGELESGGLIRVQVTPTEYKTTAEFKENDPFSVNPQEVKVGGVTAVREDKCGHPVQDSICVGFVKDGLYYSISYRHPNKETSESAKYKAEFEALLASFKFN